ncbi:MAG TPA: PAS domain S-box protein [Myxococcales bacterium]
MSDTQGHPLVPETPPRLHRPLLRPPRFPLWGRLAVVPACVLLAFALQLSLFPRPSLAPFVLFYFAVTLASWLGGRLAGVLTVLLGALVANYAFLAPSDVLKMDSPAVVATALFVLTATAGAFICGSLGAAAEAAQTAADRFESIVDCSPVGLVEWTPDFRIVRWSPQAERIFGWASQEMLGRRLDEVPWIHPEDMPGVLALPARMAAGEQTVTIPNTRHLHRLGSVVFCEWQSTAVLTRDGRLHSVMSLAHDVTDRERNQRELGAVFEGTHAQMALLDHEMRFVRVNESYARGSGHGRPDLIGARHFDLFPDEENRRIFERVRDTGVAFHVTEKAFRYADQPERGTTYWNWSLAPIQGADHRGTRVLLSLLEVTETVRARQRMEQLQAVTAAMSAARTPRQVADAVFESALKPMGVLGGSLALESDLGQPEVVHLCGYEEGVGPRWNELVARGVDTPSARALHRGEAIFLSAPDEMRRHFPEFAAQLGPERGRAWAALPLSASREIRGALGLSLAAPHVFSPAERDFLQSVALLAGHALDRARLFEASERRATELRESGRRKDDFLAMLSHELRNPLAPISNSVYLLERNPSLDERARRATAMLARQASHLARLVNDLLDATRISQGKLRVQATRLDLARLVGTVLEDHASMLEGHPVQVRVPEGPVWVHGDTDRLTQALGNLLSNAVKFTPAGGPLAVTLHVGSRTAVLDVQDSGVGIDREMRGRLFEPFAQSDRSLDRSAGGLGLGLALVKGIVELHGGAIRCRSDGPNQGAHFSIELPLAGAEREVGGPDPAAAARPAPAGVRVLLIEDNADAARSLAEALSLSGHEVGFATSGRQGLETAKQMNPEAIFCDLGLPDLDGFAIARSLRCAQVPVRLLVALTGYTSAEDERRARDAGFDLLVAKPAPPERLMRLLAEIRAGRPADNS